MKNLSPCVNCRRPSKVRHERGTAQPENGPHPLDSPKIEALLKTAAPAELREAGRLIETKYLPFYQVDRHLYSYDTLRKWMRIRGLNMSFELPKPNYASANLTYLPRIKVDAV